jgi:hypothetical protein
MAKWGSNCNRPLPVGTPLPWEDNPVSSQGPLQKTALQNTVHSHRIACPGMGGQGWEPSRALGEVERSSQSEAGAPSL